LSAPFSGPFLPQHLRAIPNNTLSTGVFDLKELSPSLLLNLYVLDSFVTDRNQNLLFPLPPLLDVVVTISVIEHQVLFSVPTSSSLSAVPWLLDHQTLSVLVLYESAKPLIPAALSPQQLHKKEPYSKLICCSYQLH
jgi:hypothetical protein